jgi:hypothetical protein
VFEGVFAERPAALADGHHRRRYRLDLPGDPPCSIAQEATDVVAVAEAVGEPVLLVGHPSGAVLYEPPVVTGPPLGGDTHTVQRAQAAIAAGRPGRAIAIFLRDLALLPPLVARVVGTLADKVPG